MGAHNNDATKEGGQNMRDGRDSTVGRYANLIRWQIDRTLADLTHAEMELKKLFDVLYEMQATARDVNYVPTPFRDADPVLVETLRRATTPTDTPTTKDAAGAEERTVRRV